METVALRLRRPPYFPGRCVAAPAPEYSRLCRAGGRKSRRWIGSFLQRLMRDGKRKGLLCGVPGAGVKPSTFNYDAVSYSQNFDEGPRVDEDEDPMVQRRSLVIDCPNDRVVRWDLRV